MYKKKRSIKWRRKNLSPILLGIILFSIITAFAMTNRKETEEETYYKRFRVIEIKFGDTVWDIAKENYESWWPYDDIRDYIKEIYNINHIYYGRIKEGDIMAIPYFTTYYERFVISQNSAEGVEIKVIE